MQNRPIENTLTLRSDAMQSAVVIIFYGAGCAPHVFGIIGQNDLIVNSELRSVRPLTRAKQMFHVKQSGVSPAPDSPNLCRSLARLAVRRDPQRTGRSGFDKTLFPG